MQIDQQDAQEAIRLLRKLCFHFPSQHDHEVDELLAKYPPDPEPLKPCAHCGGAPKWEGAGLGWIECASCHVQTDVPGESRNEAIAIWNRRPA